MALISRMRGHIRLRRRARDDQRPGQVAASKALRLLAGHLERGGDTARPDRVYGAERVEREAAPVGTGAEQPVKAEGAERQASSAVENIDKARMTAHEILASLPPGAQRDTVLEQIAILDKSSAALHERAGQGGDRGGTDNGEGRSSELSVEASTPDARPMRQSDRDLAEIQDRLMRERLQRDAGKPDRDRADRDWDSDR